MKIFIDKNEINPYFILPDLKKNNGQIPHPIKIEIPLESPLIYSIEHLIDIEKTDEKFCSVIQEEYTKESSNNIVDCILKTLEYHEKVTPEWAISKIRKVYIKEKILILLGDAFHLD